MSSVQSFTYGNLALEMPERVQTESEPRRRSSGLHVVGPLISDGSQQVLPADAHAALSARKGSRVHSCAKGVLALVLALVLAGSGIFLLSARSASAAALIEGVEYTEVRVASGDSLWALAEAHPVDGLETAQVVELIMEENGLSSATLQPGMLLSVPLQE